ncbi:hypothetical protein ACHAXR_011970 [Thalassiosira sp. AJA248-18]
MFPSTISTHVLQRARWHRTTLEAARGVLRPRPLSSAYHMRFAPDLTTLHLSNQQGFSSFGFHQQLTRLVSSVDTSQENIDEPTKLSQSSDDSTDNTQERADSYGASNFRKMLRYQESALKEASSKRRDDGRRKKDINSRQDFSQRQETVSNQQQKYGGGDNNKNPRSQRDADAKNNHGNGSKNLRQHWRSGPSRPYQTKKAFHRPKNHDERNPKGATSDWVIVSRVPPMSKLSDLFQSLNQITDYELQKGIIDLDALGNLENGATSNALDEIGALHSLYSTQQIDDDSIPLWTPSSDSPSNSYLDACPMILEARLHLSYRARPMGWFLRLPNRSVVHAVLNHVRQAKKYKREQEWRLKKEDGNLRQKRREWREGLWKGVWTEYERGVLEKESQAMLEDESHDDRELMWGDGLGEEENETSFEGVPSKEDGESMQPFDAEDQNHDVDDYLQKYLESYPYPAQSTSPSSGGSQYQVLKSGSMVLDIREFSPTHSEKSLLNNESPWEQHSFHLSPLFNLSDSVVRVEAPDLRTTVHDIQFLFRGYDLESISPELEDSSIVPTEFPESLGWNINLKSNVDFLVKGTYIPKQRSAFFNSDRKESIAVRAKRHTFLVRFASPAEARMAVRDKQGSKLNDQSLSVTQYPSPN